MTRPVQTLCRVQPHFRYVVNRFKKVKQVTFCGSNERFGECTAIALLWAWERAFLWVSYETAVHSVREERLLVACIVVTVWP